MTNLENSDFFSGFEPSPVFPMITCDFEEKNMKRILLIILATVLLLCTACSFQAGIGYGLDNGEKISVDFSDESYAFKMAQDRDFLITKGDEKIADVRFYDAQKGMAFINKEPIFTDNVEEIFDEGTKGKIRRLCRGGSDARQARLSLRTDLKVHKSSKELSRVVSRLFFFLSAHSIYFTFLYIIEPKAKKQEVLYE